MTSKAHPFLLELPRHFRILPFHHATPPLIHMQQFVFAGKMSPNSMENEKWV